jgi:hypothetical protein
MKQLAVVLAAVLSLMLVAPALAQPFADVPTDHWAYDAIAELAAKGLIEGYPDGSFKGDRAMTRYEMAMVVARLLARIEAIKIPPLPGDLVRTPALTAANAANAAALRAVDTRLTAKLATIQRLVAEFRAELAALGVRVTAVEEEIAAIRARLDQTRVTGDYRVRYNVFPVGSVSGGGTFRHPDVRIRMRLTFTGRVAPNVEAVVRLWAANNTACDSTTTGFPAFCGNFDVRFGNNYNYGVVSFDTAYLDVRNTWGARLWRVGRQFYTLAGFGPFGVGLLYDPSNSLATGVIPGFGTGIAGWPGSTTGLSDGIRSDWAFGPLSITAAVFRDAVLNPPTGVTPGLGAAPAIDNRIVRVTTGALLPGWTLGGSYYQAWQHPTATGINVGGGTGWGLDLSGTLMPGLTLYVDYATWASIPTVGGATLASAPAWRVGGNINLAQVAGITTWAPTLDLAYHNYGPLPAGALPPVNTYATTLTGQVFPFDMRGWMARLNLTFSPATAGWILYESGTQISSGLAYSEWWLRATHRVAPGTTLTANYFRGTRGGVDFFNFYRAELLYSW